MQATAQLGGLSASRPELEPAQVVSSVVRRSGRISKEIAVLLSGSDTDGRQFSERTKTLVLSRHGGSVLSRYKLVPEQEIFLRLLTNDREIEMRVCGEIGEREDGHIYGMAFVNPEVDFWGIEFPPSEKLPISLIELALECSGCKDRTTVRFDATELDVFTVNDGVLRYCKRCLRSTVWKRAAAAVPATTASAPPPAAPSAPPGANSAALAGPPPVAKTDEPAQPGFSHPAGGAVAQTQQGPGPIPNRRRERRTKVRFSACIRSSGASEEVVECEDMSRGGFSFRSGREYSVEAMIEAAVPYSPGGGSIFVPAQIANVRELQKGKLFRYGAAYLASSKK